MNDPALRPTRFPWPVPIFLVAAVVALLLDVFYPLPWIGSPLADILVAVGWLLAAGAAALYVLAFRAFRRARTTLMPHAAASALITDGPFKLTRNPLYLANTMLMVGIGLITGNPWFPLFGLLAAFGTQKLAIEPEERHLDARFGRRYRDYAKKVRRWI